MPRPLNDTDTIALEKSPDGNGRLRLTVNGKVVCLRVESHNPIIDVAMTFSISDTVDNLIAEAMSKSIDEQCGIIVPRERILELWKASK